MTRSNKVLAVLLAVQLVLAVFVFLRRDEGRIGKLEPLLADLDAGKVDRIRVFDEYPPPKEEEGAKDGKKERAPDQPAVELVKRGSEWALTSHHDYPADASKVSELLEKVAAIRSRGPIASGAARQKQLEVADQAYQRKLVLTSGGKDITLLVGASAGLRQTSVRLAGSSEIHGASGLSAFAIGAEPASWVDTGFFKVEKEQIASVEISNQNGTFTLEPAGDGWSVELNGKPVAVPAGSEIDKDFLDQVVSRVSALTMSEPGDPKRTIDKPTVTVTLRMKAEQPAAGADGGPPAVSQPGQEYTIDLAEASEKDRTFVRVRGSKHAALVNALSVSDLSELSAQRVVRKIADKPAAPPAGEGMEGLPPGIDLEQLQQQMQQGQ